jgi:hypothetical protein
MILENGLQITKQGFRSIDPLTGKVDVEISTKGRINPKTGKWVKPVIIEHDSLTRFDEMPKESYDMLSDTDAFIVGLYRRDKLKHGYACRTASEFMSYIKRSGKPQQINR